MSGKQSRRCRRLMDWCWCCAVCDFAAGLALILGPRGPPAFQRIKNIHTFADVHKVYSCVCVCVRDVSIGKFWFLN